MNLIGLYMFNAIHNLKRTDCMWMFFNMNIRIDLALRALISCITHTSVLTITHAVSHLDQQL